jgi:ribonuclease Z
MRITLLGTGGPLPDANRAGPATLVQTGSTNILIDAGRAVMLRLTAAGVGLPSLSGVLLTHLHSDHITDLNDVITGHWLFTQGAGTLTIFGPPGTCQVVEAIAAMLVLDVGYRIEHHDDLEDGPDVTVVEVAPGTTFELGETTITVGETNHRPVHPTVGYRIDDGEKSVVLGGDGIPVESLDELCRGADAYVQTVLRRDIIEPIPLQMLQDVLDYHSSVEDAAQTAARAGVGTLMLTHYIPAMPPGAEAEWRALAEPYFAGTIVLGDDLSSGDL